MHFKILHGTPSIRPIVAVLVFLFCLSGCQISFLNLFGGGKERVRHTPEGLYAGGVYEFNKGNYKKAREYFTLVKEGYPLHEMTIMARIGIADSYFSQKKYAEAENEYNDFIIFHPTNENVPYVLYQIGMCHYNRIEAIDRDQTSTVLARREFEKLLARYPESKFALMAEEKLRDCKQKLAEHEFYVGQFYFHQKKYQAALARFETVEREYANVGLDYKVAYFINETKIRIAEEEKLEREKKNKLQKEKEGKTRSARN
jgi:outer membrane protein assembly factor BamD